MKRFFLVAMVLLLLAGLLTACRRTENPPTEHVVYKGQLYEITTRVSEPYELDESKLIEAKLVSLDVLPHNEYEVNAAASSARIYELDDTQILVIIDGTQYIVKVQ